LHDNVQTMTSLEIAELTGKQHSDLLRAIRKMEPAWEKTCKCKFALTSRTIVQPNGGTREVPCYSLTKTECLYIATKFNDEARARLVLRWEELERERLGADYTDLHGLLIIKTISDLHVGSLIIIYIDGTEPFMVWVHLERDGQIVHFCEQKCHQYSNNPSRSAHFWH